MMAYRSVQHRIVRATNHISGSNIVYIENPKVACSNIKWALVGAFSADNLSKICNIHDRRETKFVTDYRKIIQTLKNPSFDIFSVVRHPRDRFISAYFDKMHYGRDESVWSKISSAFNLEEDVVYEPKIILDKICKFPPQDLDSHIARQTTNIFFEHIDFSNIYHLEKLAQGTSSIKVGNYDLQMVDHQSHSTKSRMDLKIFDEEALEMIDDIYLDDYSVFGYLPTHSIPANDISTPEARPFLLEFLASEAPVKCLLDFFANGPRKMSYIETGAVIDIISQQKIWDRMPHRIVDFVIARNALIQGDNAARFAAKFSGFPEN